MAVNNATYSDKSEKQSWWERNQDILLTELSTSLIFAGYVPYIDLRYYSVWFRGKEMGIEGPTGLKYANSRTNTVILNNKRKLHGEVRIESIPPF